MGRWSDHYRHARGVLSGRNITVTTTVTDATVTGTFTVTTPPPPPLKRLRG